MAELRNSLSGGDSLVGILSAVDTLSGEISPQATMSATMSVPEVVQAEPFLGEYTYDPTDEVQTIEINGLRATDNITINPVPSNYGLITWDGATLTVS